MGRFFIEPFLWLTVGSLFYLSSKNNLALRICKKIITINSIVIFTVISFTIISFIPGIFSIKNHKNILTKYANGYNLYVWANENLPSDSVILTTHRSYLFSENEFVSYDFRLYVETEEGLNHYLDLLIQKQPTHILYNDLDRNLKQDFLKNCRGKLVAKGKNVHNKNPRNPFNKNKVSYDGYIYEINVDNLKKCKKVKYFN